MTTQPLSPKQMTKAIAFKCTKGYKRNCPCKKKKIPCYIGCCCQGAEGHCSHAQYAKVFRDRDSDSDSHDNVSDYDN